ncbi:MAG: ABC transporter permease [Saprospiraceae bacterium]|nr:ABC transporter permease [Saprospiraceae bacterium]
MNSIENVKIALRSIKDNILRSLLTLLIIAVGIACLVGMLTAIDGLLFSMSDNFNRLGANSYNFRRSSETITTNTGGRQRKRGAPINFDDAYDFKEAFDYSGSVVSIDTYCSGNATVRIGDKETNPTVSIVGIDEEYFSTSAFEISEGRNFTKSEAYSGSNRVIIGSDIVDQLFDEKPEKAIGKSISINGAKYKVLGALEQKGNSSGSGNDRRVFIPLINAKKLYGYADRNYNVIVSVKNSTDIDDAVSQGIGVMRNVRKLKASEKNDFEIRKSDGILERLKEMTSSLRLGTIVIATLTLLGAAIGLMNIMLVSVTERTAEIGVRKALGATRSNVLIQFLTEAIVICILGGIVGIFFGVIIGYLVSLGTNSTFVTPWLWMLVGIAVCVFVGVVSGIYPALKASRLDPIESLRYE